MSKIEKIGYTPSYAMNSTPFKNHTDFVENDFKNLKKRLIKLYQNFKIEKAHELILSIRSTISAVTAVNPLIESQKEDLKYVNRGNIASVTDPNTQDLYHKRLRMLKILQIQVLLLIANKTDGWTDPNFINIELPKIEKYLAKNSVDLDATKLIQEIKTIKQIYSIESEVYSQYQISWTKEYERKLQSILETKKKDLKSRYFALDDLLYEVKNRGLKLERHFCERLLEKHKIFEIEFLQRFEKVKIEAEQKILNYLDSNSTEHTILDDEFKFLDHDTRDYINSMITVFDNLKKVENGSLVYNIKYYNTKSPEYKTYSELVKTLQANERLSMPNSYHSKIMDKMNRLQIHGKMKAIYHAASKSIKLEEINPLK